MRMPQDKLRMKIAALWVAFFIGVSVMAYPFVSNAIFQWRADHAIAVLSSAVDAGDSEAYEAERERAAAYNKELVGQTVPDVFAIREGTTDAEYEGFLNVLGDQVMGTVEIPVIGVNLPIHHYSTEESLLKGCGHIFGSSLPVGGESTHAVITAHRGLPAAKLFTDLDQVEKGDKFYLKVLDQTLAYEVESIEVVKPTETRSLAIQRGKDLVTLVTCTPYGVNTNRLLVRGHRVAYTEGEEAERVAPHASQLMRLLIEAACVALGVLAAFGIRRYGRRAGERARAEEAKQMPMASLLRADASAEDAPVFEPDAPLEDDEPPTAGAHGGKHFRVG